MSVDAVYQPEILAASYGDRDVTAKVQALCQAAMSVPFASGILSFTVNTQTFGFDPMPGQTKTFVAVFRAKLITGTGIPPRPNAPQSICVQDGQTAMIGLNPGDPAQITPWSPTAPQDGLIVIAAYWGTEDVTQILVGKNADMPWGQGTLSFSVDSGHLGAEPQVGTTKQFSFIYAYAEGGGSYEIHMKLARDNGMFSVRLGPPPKLMIHAANYAGVDCTAQMQALVDPADQTLTLDLTRPYTPFSSDPWPTVHKAMVILYSWISLNGNERPKELLVTDEGTGIWVLDPQVIPNPSRTAYFNSSQGGVPGRPYVAAMVWGIMQGHPTAISAEIFATVEANMSVVPSNATMGFDGWFGVPKVLLIFYVPDPSQPSIVRCAAIKEGNTAVSFP